jgi:flagellar biosynthesis regulator FlaF
MSVEVLANALASIHAPEPEQQVPDELYTALLPAAGVWATVSIGRVARKINKNSETITDVSNALARAIYDSSSCSI